MEIDTRQIAVAVPDLSGNEEKYLLDAFRSGWISATGEYIERFETGFASAVGAEFALGVCNGTSALHLTLLGLEVGPGDEVIVPSFTFIATVNAVMYVGARPVFVDIARDNWCIDPALIEAAITPRTKGIISVDMYGHPADYDAINHIARRHGLWVVEDAAEAHGALYKDRPAGSLADAATFSFFGNKVLTSGEGGAVTCNDDRLYEKLLMLRGQGVDPNRRYYFPIIGYNFRITNLACAILCAQLERMEQIIRKRREVFARYDRNLRGTPGLIFQSISEWATPSPWMYSLRIEPEIYGCDRDELMGRLLEQGVDTRPFFIPIHLLPPYQHIEAANLPVTLEVAATGLTLPTYTEMSFDDIDYICERFIALGRS